MSPPVKHLRFLRGLFRHIDLVNRGWYPIYLDYPVHPRPRYGWGSPPHAALRELFSAEKRRYRAVLDDLAQFADGLRAIPLAGTDPVEPHWANGYVAGLDAATLYAFPRLYGSTRYLEIGSGNSTRFVRRSVRDHGLGMSITSIDPAPRREVDAICDQIHRCGLEDAPREPFDALRANDILALDGSHRCFQNSDVAVFFLEILPELAPGVLVFIHDIYLPDDYPVECTDRFYSEQYVLAALLLGDLGRRYEIVFPAHFVERNDELGPHAHALWATFAPPTLPLGSSGLWLRVRSTR
jgi:hypothetical protein